MRAKLIKENINDILRGKIKEEDENQYYCVVSYVT
jgi:hypothetical protein